MREIPRGRLNVMGISDRDGDSWGRSRSPREDRMGDGGRAERRTYERPARGGAASWDSERPDRGKYDEASPRMSSGGWERPRGSYREDEGRGGRRGGRRYGEDDTWGTNGGSPGGSTGRGRPPRDERMGDYPTRGARQPVRGDDRGERERDRRAGAGAGMMRGGAVPRGGGLWGDEEVPRRRRPDADDPRARAANRRDPRMLRKGLIDTSGHPAVAKKGGLSFGTALLIIVLMFLIGAGGAYGYFRFSAPRVHVPSSSAPATAPASITPSASPKASPSASPQSNVPATHLLNVVL